MNFYCITGKTYDLFGNSSKSFQNLNLDLGSSSDSFIRGSSVLLSFGEQGSNGLRKNVRID